MEPGETEVRFDVRAVAVALRISTFASRAGHYEEELWNQEGASEPELLLPPITQKRPLRNL